MKIRTNFVSNSSSSSFAIPSKLLTDEQKEMLLSLDNWKKERAELHAHFGKPNTKITITSENNYPRSKEYHKIYQKMLCDNQVHDSWMIDERRHYEGLYWIGGVTSMDNGSMNILMEKIDIDPSIVE